MFVDSRLSSLAAARPICNYTRAAHARVFRTCNSIHDFKPIEFFFFLTQHSTYLYFISFPIYPALCNASNIFNFPASLLHPRARLFINTCRHSATFFKGCAKSFIALIAKLFLEYATFRVQFYPARDNIALRYCGAMRAAYFSVPFPRMHVRTLVFAHCISTGVSFAPRGL